MSEPAKRPPFVPLTGFIETAFAQRFQGMLRYAWREHTWHVIAAPPGSGKSLGIKDMVANSGAYKRVDGKNRTYLPILDVISPKGEASQNALIAQIATAYGVIPSMPSSTRRTYVAQQMARAQTELLIIDDAQDLSVKQLSYIKELTDYLQKLPFDRTIGLCFVTANQGRATPLKEYFDRSDMLWNQFRERLDPEFAYTVIRGHNENEVRDILATVQEEYRAQFPDLQLVPYAQSIYAWLIHPALDPENTGWVRMRHLMQFLTVALRAAYRAGATDITPQLLAAVADFMTQKRGDVTVINQDTPARDLRIREIG